MNMKELTAKQVQQKLEAKETLHLIDVREDDEVAQGIIPGAAHMVLNTIPEHVDELDKDKAYILICRSGGRSGKAQAFLQEKGFDVTNMTGGMLDWEGPTE